MTPTTRTGHDTQGLAPEDVDLLLRAAVRAPSLHNSQPWAFAFGDHHVEVYADPHGTGDAAGYATARSFAAAESVPLTIGGGIRDTATALAMLDGGASRLGLSGTRAVLDGL